LTGDYIAVDEEEEDDLEEQELKPEPKLEIPPQGFAHGSIGAGYEAGAESWGMP
jgi:hypothetical protein